MNVGGICGQRRMSLAVAEKSGSTFLSPSGKPCSQEDETRSGKKSYLSCQTGGKIFFDFDFRAQCGPQDIYIILSHIYLFSAAPQHTTLLCLPSLLIFAISLGNDVVSRSAAKIFLQKHCFFIAHSGMFCNRLEEVESTYLMSC